MKVQIEISARHIHLSSDDCLELFGSSELHKRNNLSQKGEFAAEETVEIVGPNTSMHKVRVLGPIRPATQLEISKSDAYALGIDPPLALSGSGAGTMVKIVGPKGTILRNVAMIAKRHFHASSEVAKKLHLKNNDEVSLRIKSDRFTIFGKVVVRIADTFSNKVHLDTDEGNAAGIKSGDYGDLIIRKL